MAAQVRRVGLPREFQSVLGTDGWPRDVYVGVGDARWNELSWGRWGGGKEEGEVRHCFVDDWRLEAAWRRPADGVARAMMAGVVTEPDYSVYSDEPLPWAQYQTWRGRVVAEYWRAHGVLVVPVLRWGSAASYEICARGIWRGSVVAVRGPTADEAQAAAWMQGWQWMVRRLWPSLALIFGRCSPEVLGVPVVRLALRTQRER